VSKKTVGSVENIHRVKIGMKRRSAGVWTGGVETLVLKREEGKETGCD
jgi:hypothetical protein